MTLRGSVVALVLTTILLACHGSTGRRLHLLRTSAS